MALTLVFNDGFSSDTSANYDFGSSAAYMMPPPLDVAGGHLNIALGLPSNEWAISPKGISISGDGVQVCKFHWDADARQDPNAELSHYWGDAGPDIDPYSGASFLVPSSTDSPLTLRTYAGDLSHSDTTVTIPNGAFTGWLVTKRVSGTVTSEVWDTDPGRGGAALASVSRAETAGDAAQRVSVEWASPHGGYVDYWNVYTGTGAIPVQDSAVTTVPSRSLLNVGT
jgi:hypothetical protein